ncbi:MAG: phospho-sugar mutase [Deltaproteobacteria bacterium]|nr:phospho-sugar mutase [Deltaproteobacteria bacterium]
MIDPNVLARAEEWLAHDPDAETRAELAPLIASRSPELIDRFAGPLKFGTAGLRGVLGAGESRMNRAVVRRATLGLARYLLAHEPEAMTRGVVVGYDGRKLGREFAEDTAAVLLASGIPVHLSERVCPTPLVAFAVTDLGAVAGVMVTASHNPPEYNGYKAYARNGAQIIPPADTSIAAEIEAGPHADAIELRDLAEARASGALRDLGEDVRRRYLDAVAGLFDPNTGDRSLSIVYTPLHGVGLELCAQALGEAGFTNVYIVREQAEPDGNFPTVEFPNPEEKGALDLALELARAKNAELILANDPDADRLAAVVRTKDGGYRQLTGNDVGVLLGHHRLERDAANPKPGRPLVITTIVSSPLLGVIAEKVGAGYDETLTGFKWIANKAMEREASEGARFVFGYEEALGYSVGTVARDKDGIGAAVVLAVLAAELHAQGKTLLDELERIGTLFGSFVSRQRSLGYPGAEGTRTMAGLMAKLRASPPTEVAGVAVRRLTDCLARTRTDASGTSAISLPKSDVLILDLDGGHRVIARPSGTEPKLKIYFDVRLPAGTPTAELRAEGERLIDALEHEMVARMS